MEECSVLIETTKSAEDKTSRCSWKQSHSSACALPHSKTHGMSEIPIF